MKRQNGPAAGGGGWDAWREADRGLLPETYTTGHGVGGEEAQEAGLGPLVGEGWAVGHGAAVRRRWRPEGRSRA